MISQPQFIYNKGYHNFYRELVSNLETCQKFMMSVAFVRYSRLQLLLEVFSELEKKNIEGKILTSTYLNSTEPKALERLLSFKNIKTKVYVPSPDRGFHTKAYVFDRDGSHRVIIGSSNITQPALKSNFEWNVLNEDTNEAQFTQDVLHEFNAQWNDERSQDLSDAFLKEYRAYVNRIEKEPKRLDFEYQKEKIVPNKMQLEAISKIDLIRKKGEDRALAIAATGSGKTYLAVFDSLQFRPKRLLFLVHREDILLKAKQSFEAIFGPTEISTGLYTGTKKDSSVDFLFATMQTMQNHLPEFPPDYFEYIVVDEAHHAVSPSFEKILNWFKPKFMLGLTATPERADSGDIFSVFGNNIAVEIRLRQALEWELVVPFHYFGITDIKEIDYEKIGHKDIDAIARLLKVNRRVEFIIEKMNFFGFDGTKRKAIGFCATVDHSRYMEEEFNRRGISSLSLTSEDSPEVRSRAIERLESDIDPLEVLFAVDVFNEGIDIPSINTVLMLRPTESPIVFIQQLGRGLRKAPNKEFVTVLDFIGNHRKSFLIAIALMGTKHFDKDDLKVAVASDFADIPGSSHIQMDRISKEQILAQVETEKFMTLKYLKEQYEVMKRICNRVPKLVDYLRVDGAPDPTRYMRFSGTWAQFVDDAETSGRKDKAPYFSFEQNELSFLRFLTDIMPLRRIYEFVVALSCISNGNISVEAAQLELKKHLSVPDLQTIAYTFEFLSGKFLDSGEKVRFNGLLFELKGEVLSPSIKTLELLKSEKFRDNIIDLLNYGIIRYGQEFGTIDYGVPHLKLFEAYTMRSIALLSNMNRTHSSVRGMGLITADRDFYIFVDLHKGENIKESVNYKDAFIDPSRFQWETPNSTSPDTEQGQNLVNHLKRGIRLHLFARKFRKIEGKPQPYVYFGQVDYNGHDPERSKPMRIYFHLHHEVPSDLYYEITTLLP